MAQISEQSYSLITADVSFVTPSSTVSFPSDGEVTDGSGTPTQTYVSGDYFAGDYVN